MSDLNIKEKIKDYLNIIKKNSKKLKSKMSRHIGELNDFLKEHILELNDLDIEFLLMGEPSTPGLLKFCATKTKFSGEIKNSALTALKLLRDLLMNQENHIFREIFTQIDSE